MTHFVHLCLESVPVLQRLPLGSPPGSSGLRFSINWVGARKRDGEEGGHPRVLPTMLPRSKPGVRGARGPGVSTAGLRRLVQHRQSEAAVGSLPQYPRAPKVPDPGGKGGGASLALQQLHERCHFLKSERGGRRAREAGSGRWVWGRT